MSQPLLNEWAAILPDSEYRPDGNRLQIFDAEMQGQRLSCTRFRLSLFQNDGEFCPNSMPGRRNGRGTSSESPQLPDRYDL